MDIGMLWFDNDPKLRCLPVKVVKSCRTIIAAKIWGGTHAYVLFIPSMIAEPKVKDRMQVKSQSVFEKYCPSPSFLDRRPTKKSYPTKIQVPDPLGGCLFKRPCRPSGLPFISCVGRWLAV